MKKNNALLFIAAVFGLFLASCAAPRTYAPHALSTVSTVSLPELQYSLERKDYEILDTIKAAAVVTVTTSKEKSEIKAEGEFLNICNISEAGDVIYNVGESTGTLRAGFIDGLNLGELEPCSGYSMASSLAAYRLINEVKTSGADGIVAPSLYVTAEESGETITYKVEISAKLIKLNTAN
ncbi:hypothetical protein J6Z39_07955 [bacterium]|nr:hypothetical protein [bacterium]